MKVNKKTIAKVGAGVGIGTALGIFLSTKKGKKICQNIKNKIKK